MNVLGGTETRNLRTRTFLYTLLLGDLREVGSGLLDAPLRVELDPDAVDADLPVEVVGGVLEVAQDGHGDDETR